MCGYVGLDAHATDFTPVPSFPFTEPAFSLSPVMPSVMSPWFPAALLTPGPREQMKRKRRRKEEWCQWCNYSFKRDTSCAWLPSALQGPHHSSRHGAGLLLPFLLFHFAPSGLRPTQSFCPSPPHLSFLLCDRGGRCRGLIVAKIMRDA